MNTQESKAAYSTERANERQQRKLLEGWNTLRNKVSKRRGKRKYWM